METHGENGRIDWTYSEQEWAAYARWVRREAFHQRAAWVVCLCAAAAGCVAHIRGFGGAGVIGWALVGLVFSAAPLAVTWRLTRSRQAEVLGSRRVFRLASNEIELCGEPVPLGGKGWRLASVDVRLRPPVLLELGLVRDAADERESRTVWAPVPSGQEDAAVAFAAVMAAERNREGRPS
jgi:hypothetical protein